MNDLAVYRIQIDRQADQQELRATSPLDMQVELLAGNITLLTVYTDQSGIMGLLRHLHGRGFVILSMQREPDPINARS